MSILDSYAGYLRYVICDYDRWSVMKEQVLICVKDVAIVYEAVILRFSGVSTLHT
jgi:hypothetical protein